MQIISNQTQSPKLLNQVAVKMRVKYYSSRTEKSYVDWIKRYILHFNKHHPKDMGAAEVEAFLAHLAVTSCFCQHEKLSQKRVVLFV